MTDPTNSTRYYSLAGQNTRMYKNSVYNHLRKLINDMGKNEKEQKQLWERKYIFYKNTIKCS